MTEAETNSESMWIRVTVANQSSVTLTIKNYSSSWGKIYDYPNKSKELDKDTINNHDIKPGKEFSWACSGRQGSASGTTGSVDVYEGGDKVGTISWDCPWSGTNSLGFDKTDPKWFVEVPTVDPDGAIGNVTITFFKRSS